MQFIIPLAIVAFVWLVWFRKPKREKYQGMGQHYHLIDTQIDCAVTNADFEYIDKMIEAFQERYKDVDLWVDKFQSHIKDRRSKLRWTMLNVG